jgi:GT2 family glycosyltransferase
VVTDRTANDLPNVAVVIVSWNNREIIGQCLASVAAQRFPKEHLYTYVVDNGSDDDSVAFVQQTHPSVTVVEVGWNSGFAIANNIGIRRAIDEHAVDYVILLNSDAALSPDWIAKMVTFATSRPRGACFQSLTVDGARRDFVDSRHLFVDRDLQAAQADYGQPVGGRHRTQRVFGVNAAAALYNTAFFAAQPFQDVLDEKMWMYLEDVDLSTRALMMGWENWTVAGPTAFHLGSASTNTRASGFALRQTMRNQPVLWLTNFPAKTIWRAIPGIIRHDRGAVRHLKFTQQVGVVSQMLKGRMQGLGLIPYALRRRRQLKPFVRLPREALDQFMTTGTLKL